MNVYIGTRTHGTVRVSSEAATSTKLQEEHLDEQREAEAEDPTRSNFVAAFPHSCHRDVHGVGMSQSG